MTIAIFHTDVVIVGAGPVGLFSIFECGMNKLKCHVIEALDSLGGQCAALYPEKPIYDIPAYPHITGGDLVQNLIDQAAPFDPVYHLNQNVLSLDKQDDGTWKIVTSAGNTFYAKAVIIAAGVGAFGPNRPPLKNIEDFEGHSIHYCVKSRLSYKDKNIVIAGGGDSAVDWAISLAEIAKKVSVVHRRPKFRCAPESESRLKQLAEEGKIDLVVPYQLSALEGTNAQLHCVIVESLDGSTKSLEADILLPFFGLSMNLGPILEWGLNLDKSHITIDQSTAKTSLQGIYAVGDIATYQGKLKLILTGFAEAAQAAHDIRRYIYPDEVIHFEYSTTKGVPASA